MSAVKEEISKAQKYMTHGVYVISTAHKGKLNALTAAWAARASFVPPLITVSVGTTRFSHDMIKESGIFAVSILGPEDMGLGKQFGLKTGRGGNKVAGGGDEGKTKRGAGVMGGVG